MVHIGIGLGCDWPVARLAIGGDTIIYQIMKNSLLLDDARPQHQFE